MTAKRKWVTPDPGTEKEAKECIAVGYSWFYINRKAIYMLRKAPVYLASLAAIIAAWNYITTPKSEFRPPESSTGFISSTAYAGEERVEIDTMLILQRIKGTDWILVRHKMLPNDPPSKVQAEALLKMDEYYADKLKARKK